MRPIPIVRPPEPAIDPICGMTVDPATAAAKREHGGKTYWFCSAGCAAKFSTDPDGWISGTARAKG